MPFFSPLLFWPRKLNYSYTLTMSEVSFISVLDTSLSSVFFKCHIILKIVFSVAGGKR
jgi:hypothetical protein